MPVGSLLWPRARNTLLLTILATGLAWLASLIIGVMAASARSSAARNLIRGSMAILISIPDVVIALVLLLLAARTRWFPVGGMQSAVISGPSSVERSADIAVHLVLPVLALMLAGIPMLARHVHASVSESAASPAVQAARAHGIPRRRLLFVYTLPAAANPLVSLFGLSIGGLLSTSLLVEVMMGWPGLGPLLLDAILSRDIHIVIGATMLSAMFLIVGNFIADAILFASDPRIRQQQ
jgi:peptide/nickel transport system permease protein